MNAEHEDEEFVGLRVSGHTRQNRYQAERLKNYCEKVRRWLLVTRTPAQLQGPHVMSRLTGPAWDACDELELEDVATADGVNMILNTLAEAFQGEYDMDKSHTAFALQAKERHLLSKRKTSTWNWKATLIWKNQCPGDTAGLQKTTAVSGRAEVSSEQEHEVRSDDISCQPNVDCECGEKGMSGTHGLHATCIHNSTPKMVHWSDAHYSSNAAQAGTNQERQNPTQTQSQQHSSTADVQAHAPAPPHWRPSFLW